MNVCCFHDMSPCDCFSPLLHSDTNLADKYPEVADQLNARLDEILTGYWKNDESGFVCNLPSVLFGFHTLS